MNTIDRIQTIRDILSHTYPDAKIALSYRNPWELLVAVILSAQCTDVMVNKVTAKLFKKYPDLDDYVNADLKIFEQDIKSTGFYHNKAKHILAAAKKIKGEFGGVVPDTMENILTLPGVARKTANVVLGNAYGVIDGIAVDTHVIRLSQRLRLVDINKIGGKHILYDKSCERGGAGRGAPTKGSPCGYSWGKTRDRTPTGIIIDYIKDADPVKIERELMAIIPKTYWFSLTYQLIDHGRAICKAQKPMCHTCPLSKFCPASRTVL